jgi:hypothetical protein
MDDHKKAQESWERFLNPDKLRPTLMLASIYISTFEILKDIIVSRIKNFYSTSFDESGEIIDPAYKSEVLERNSSPVYASLLWLKESEAITDDDLEKFNQIKKQRNDIAHQMFEMLSHGLPIDFAERFNDMTSLLDKIEKWWILNVEIPIGMLGVSYGENGIEVNDDVTLDDFDLDEIIPGPIASLRMLVEIAIGSDEESHYYFNEFIKATRKDS